MKLKTLPPVQPGAATTYEQDGTTLTVSANGDNTVLLELATDTQYIAYNITPKQLIHLWKAMVDASGFTPQTLSRYYRDNNLIQPPTPKPLTRQQRRAQARKTKHTGNSFQKPKEQQ